MSRENGSPNLNIWAFLSSYFENIDLDFYEVEFFYQVYV